MSSLHSSNGVSFGNLCVFGALSQSGCGTNKTYTLSFVLVRLVVAIVVVQQAAVVAAAAFAVTPIP